MKPTRSNLSFTHFTLLVPALVLAATTLFVPKLLAQDGGGRDGGCSSCGTGLPLCSYACGVCYDPNLTGSGYCSH
jgi:uncharacterized membrane protein